MDYAKKELYDPSKDEMFKKPYIDCDELRMRPVIYGSDVEYRYLHGGFEGTSVKFIFCVPLKEQFCWKFYQHLSPFPGPNEELAAIDKTGEEDFIGFSISHGAGYVESNMGSSEVFGSVFDNTIFYRSSAAVAEYCKTKARELYGGHRVYAYVFGGSGGGYKTMSCIENTTAFDGALPYVIGSPVSLPNCLTVPAHGSRVLRSCWDKIMDAVEPGGSGDIYAGLNKDEANALSEIINMGFPKRMCSVLGDNDDGSLPVLAPVVHQMDPTYFSDFWEKPGYLGSDPEGTAARDRICMRTRVVSAGMPDKSDAPDMAGASDRAGVPVVAAGDFVQDDRNGTDDAWQKMLSDAVGAFIEVEQVPQGADLYLRGVDIIFESGKAKGKKLRLKRIDGQRLIPGMSYGVDDFAQVIRELEAGDEIFLDNSDYIAIQTYHRHQVPEDLSFHAWDQFRDENGKPKYPQRAQVISYGFTTGGCGSVQDGKIQGKVMVMNNLMDGDFPWQADWYRRKVEEVYGPKAGECFRLYYNDNCPHGDVNVAGDMLRVVSYLGMLRQALVDLSDWVEKGIEPAPTTGYILVNNQVTLDADTKKRGGIQPNVQLFANGSGCAQVKAGEAVKFTAEIRIPEYAGEFVFAQFSFEGETDYPYEAGSVTKTNIDGLHGAVIEAEHVFKEPGTYFCVIRVVTNRNPEDGYTRLRNLCRVRVIVGA